MRKILQSPKYYDDDVMMKMKYKVRRHQKKYIERKFSKKFP